MRATYLGSHKQGYSADMSLSRRSFLANATFASGSVLVSSFPAVAQGPPDPPAFTVGNAVERIKQHVGVPWRTSTVDRVVEGKLDVPVQGIATTMMSTFDVCKRAQAAGCNLIITHEPTFYLHQDTYDDIKDDSVLRAKQAFLEEHEMVIFRLHDHIHAMHPDGVAKGMIEQLGWQARVIAPDKPQRLRFEGIPLARLAQEIATTLQARTVRVVGDPDLLVHNVQTSWGYCSREAGIALLADPATDVLICGETREWEVVEYAQDAITAGQKKALIVVGHVLSEQGGMIFATDWLKGFVTEVPVKFVPATEPFWRPDQPRKLTV